MAGSGASYRRSRSAGLSRALRGIDSVVVEIRCRAYCEARQRAGVLEDRSVRLLRESGLAGRLDRPGSCVVPMGPAGTGSDLAPRLSGWPIC